MASAADKATPAPRADDEVVVDTDELEDARRDPRVREFEREADAFVAALERKGRNIV
jgi:hypothetical protein